ncbi:interleukin-18 receptor 1-like [Poeciliopsis prolifica]|uniref:interleukin-18 receptor 1-like n=1 Tax=Poeciliopsis prolifica TaxID=188132 RepID=UPI002413B6D5|nr:interleukin-18 receptor 1-like [Poeciliopsis prolifica]
MFLLLSFLAVISGICPMTTKEVYVRTGDLVMLQCGKCKYDGTVVLWKLEAGQKTQLYSNMSASEQQRLGLVLFQDSLVILSATLNHQGNYSCGPLRNTGCQMEFRLTVYSELSREAEFGNRYSQTCYKNQTCELNCPEENLPILWELLGIAWHKDNGEISEDYFLNVDVEKSGVYICTRSFLYSGQTYNTSFTVVLDVQTEKPLTNLGIFSPMNGKVFEVELGKTAEITCTALIDSSDGSSLFWLRNDEFVENNDTLRYFYNDTYSKNTSVDDVIWVSATLVFREVLEEDLSAKFSCKLESAELTRFVSVTLDKTAGPSAVILTACVACIVVVMAVIVATYVKFKIDVTLFLRDKLGSSGCQNNKSDEKSYDAFLMCYKSVTDEGLSEEDRKCLASTLEDEFGYSICLFDRDVLPGQVAAQAVLDCIEQSRAVVLVPSFPDPEPGSAVLSAIHASLVERKTRLIFINTEQTEASASGSFPEALQLLSKAGNSVTWKGRPPCTSFWKQLRYHLPAPQQTPKMQLLSHDC